MIDLIIDESFKALRNIRSAEVNLKDQKYACGMLISASYHLNTIMNILRYKNLYEDLRKEYERVSDDYLEMYSLKVINE